MRTTYIRMASAILGAFCMAACSNDEPSEGNTLSGDEVHFVATLTPNATVTTREATTPPPLTNAVGDVTVIAPGYANTEATWQRATYTVTDNAAGALTIKTGEEKNAIKRVGVNMPVAAWTTPTGVTPDKDKPSGTVDFTSSDLENFVGAAATTVLGADNKLTAVLPFRHLVGKLTLTIKDNADKDVTAKAIISFPSIKKQGTYSASLTELPQVRNGNTGEMLSKTLSDTDTPVYLPPFGNFAENGTFTLTVGGVDYLGTLNNLKLDKKPIEQIAAGQHIVFTIKVLDDHSLDFIGITLAPWNESKEGEVNNRPCPGIWGGRDLIDFATGYNAGKAGDADFIKKYITKDENGNPVVRLYTDIEVGAGFAAIGTQRHPFGGADAASKDITFDGNGYTISGLSTTGANYQGLFGCTTNATLHNIRLTAATIKGDDYIGALVGCARAGTTINNCRIAQSSVSGASHVGAVAGKVEAGVSVTNCTVDGGSVSASVENAGGIAGSAAGTIRNCYAILSNGLSGKNAGGLVGNLEATATLQNCYASPVFTNGTNVATNGTLIGCLATGATISYLYWDIACIDNSKCKSAVGGQESPTISNSQPFNALSGRLVNAANLKDEKTYLFDRLNDNISSLVVGSSNKGWAIIGTSYLPILRP